MKHTALRAFSALPCSCEGRSPFSSSSNDCAFETSAPFPFRSIGAWAKPPMERNARFFARLKSHKNALYTAPAARGETWRFPVGRRDNSSLILYLYKNKNNSRFFKFAQQTVKKQESAPCVNHTHRALSPLCGFGIVWVQTAGRNRSSPQPTLFLFQFS